MNRHPTLMLKYGKKYINVHDLSVLNSSGQVTETRNHCIVPRSLAQ